MPIDLGLSRISVLLARLGNPQKQTNFVHIAGTNGKGSVCAYVSSLLLHNTTCTVGKFTSPHLIYRHDSVTVNNKAVDKLVFEEAEREVMAVNAQYGIGATEFETLTATALHIFHKQNVDIAVMEVGLGGRLDATNVLKAAVVDVIGVCLEKGVIVTGITKIGLDHENILGSNLKEIANEKAGIIKEGVPNVVDGTNEHEVLVTVQNKAEEMKTLNHEVRASSNEIETSFGTVSRGLSPLQGDYQLQNLSISLKIIDLIFPFLQKNYTSKINFTLSNVQKGIQSVQWPGRLQNLDLKYSKDKPAIRVLLDGAHNGQAAKELSTYIHNQCTAPITFVLAVTKGKDLEPLLGQLVRPEDKVIVTRFGPVDGMPWISANPPEALKNEVAKYSKKVTVVEEIPEVFEHVSENENVVICGSLYLVGEVLKLHEQNTQ